MTFGEAARAAAARLASAGIETPDIDARLLAQAAFGLDAAQLLSAGRKTAPADGLARLGAFAERRASGEPVGRILGRREFWGLDFALAPETLEPRPDTETIVETALRLIEGKAGPLRILDLGTGTGCILLALLSELSNAWGLGVDRSPGAAAAAARNAAALGLSARAAFMAGDWAGAIAGGFDLVVSNPPYIASAEIAGLAREVRVHDPALALDGGADGLDAYRAIIAELPRLLAVGGCAVLELGIGQEAAVSELGRAAGFAPIAARPDLGGVPRALALRRL